MTHHNLFKRGVLRGGTALTALATLGAGLATTAILAPVSAAAQDITSGSISGTVTDEAGNPVQDATVVIDAVGRGLTRTVTTSPGGTFSASQLPLGTYTVTISKSGYQTVRSDDVSAALGGASYNFQLGAVGTAGNEEEIVITGARARAIDFSQAATGIVVDVQSTFNNLPIARDVSAIQRLAPQALEGDTAFNSPTGGINVALGGGSVAENIYYINGMNVTNFRTFVGGGTIPFEFYDQVQVKTGGYQAEFGRSTGGAVIAVSRSGSNDMQGGFNAFWAPNGLRSDSPDTFAAENSRDQRQDYEGNIWASGPIIEDRVYFFGFFNPRFKSFTDYQTNGTKVYSSTKEPFYGGKLDFDIADGHRLELTYFDNNDTERGSITAPGEDGAPDLVTPYTVEAGGRNIIARYSGAITDWLTISGLYGDSKFAKTSASDQPYIIEGRTGTLFQIAGHPDALQDTGFDKRKLYRVDVDLNFNALGEHHVRFGADREDLFSEATQEYSGGIYYRYYRAGANGALGGLVPANTDYVRVRNLNSSGSFKAQNTAFYIQDSWDVTDQLNLNIGIRNETFENMTATGETFTKLKNQWAPRIGVNFDVFGDRRTKISAFYGRYHLPVAANTNIRLAGNELFTQDWYLLNSVDPVTRIPVLGNLLLEEVLSDSQGANPDTLVSKNLKPQYQDEFILSAEHRFGDRWKASLTGTYRELKNVLEDTDLGYTIANFCATQNMPGCNAEETPAGLGSGGYILLNPGREAIIDVDLLGDGNLTEITIPTDILDLPQAKRKYYALEAKVDREWDGQWQLSASYVWSSLKGNYEGGVKSDNGQDDTGLTQDFDEPGWMDGAYGFLPNHRRHTFKVYGAYSVTDRLLVGAFARLQSPRKFGCIGVYDPTIGGPDRATESSAASWYCQGALVGRGRAFESEWRKDLDLSVSYTLPIAGLKSVQLRADVFNVLNLKSKIDYRELGEDDGGNPDPNYRKVSAFQNPRTVRFGLMVNF
jgi:hypothetical protein